MEIGVHEKPALGISFLYTLTLMPFILQIIAQSLFQKSISILHLQLLCCQRGFDEDHRAEDLYLVGGLIGSSLIVLFIGGEPLRTLLLKGCDGCRDGSLKGVRRPLTSCSAVCCFLKVLGGLAVAPSPRAPAPTDSPVSSSNLGAALAEPLFCAAACPTATHSLDVHAGLSVQRKNEHLFPLCSGLRLFTNLRHSLNHLRWFKPGFLTCIQSASRGGLQLPALIQLWFGRSLFIDPYTTIWYRYSCRS